MKFKININWFDRALIVIIILELLVLILVKLYSPLNKVDFYYTSMPIISALGFMAVIVSIWYVKKGNDERLSQEYYNFYVEKIEKQKQKMNDVKLNSLIPTIPTHKTDSIFDFQTPLLSLSFIIKLDSDYEDDLKKIKNGEELDLKYFKKRNYFNALEDMINLVQRVGSFSKSNDLLLNEINVLRKLTDDHIELLSRQILSELLKEYLFFCSGYEVIFPLYEVINLFRNDANQKVVTNFFYISYDIIKQDDKLKKFLASERMSLELLKS